MTIKFSPMLSGVTLDQIQELELVFAVLTEDGWKIPRWLDEWKDNVTEQLFMNIPKENNNEAAHISRM